MKEQSLKPRTVFTEPHYPWASVTSLFLKASQNWDHTHTAKHASEQLESTRKSLDLSGISDLGAPY
jgi:transposase